MKLWLSFCIGHWESSWAPGWIFLLNLLIWHKGLLHFCSSYSSFYTLRALYILFSSSEDFHGLVVKAVTISLHPYRTAHPHKHTIPYQDKVAHFLGTPSGYKSFFENFTGPTPQCSLLQPTPLGVSFSSLCCLVQVCWQTTGLLGSQSKRPFLKPGSCRQIVRYAPIFWRQLPSF